MSLDQLLKRHAVPAIGLSAVALCAASAQAGLTTIDFDGTGAPNVFAQTTPLRDLYAGLGVRFRGPSERDGGAVRAEQGRYYDPLIGLSTHLGGGSGRPTPSGPGSCPVPWLRAMPGWRRRFVLAGRGGSVVGLASGSYG